MRIAALSTLLVAALSVPGLAQDEPLPAPGKDEPAPVADEAETPPARAARTEVWHAWAREFVEQLVAEDRREEAIEELIACGRLHPEDPDPWAEAALLAIELGSMPGESLSPGRRFYGLAEQMISNAVLRKGKGDPRLAYAIGRLRFADASANEEQNARAKQWAICHRMFKDALEGGFDPVVVEPWYFRATVNRSELLLNSADQTLFQEAVDTLTSGLEKYSRLPAITPKELLLAKMNLAEAHRRLDQRRVSERILAALIEEHPQEPGPHLKFGQVLVDQSKIAEALELFRKAEHLSRMRSDSEGVLAETFRAQADAYLKSSPPDLAKAEQAVARFLRLRRDDPAGFFFQGLIALERGDHPVARRLFRRVRRMDRADYQALVKLKNVLYQMGEEEEAAEVQLALEALDRRRLEIVGGRKDKSPDTEAPPDGSGPDDASDPPDEQPPGDRDDDGSDRR